MGRRQLNPEIILNRHKPTVPTLYTDTKIVKENQNNEWKYKIFNTVNIEKLITYLCSNDILQRHYGVAGLKMFLSECNSVNQTQ